MRPRKRRKRGKRIKPNWPPRKYKVQNQAYQYKNGVTPKFGKGDGTIDLRDRMPVDLVVWLEEMARELGLSRRQYHTQILERHRQAVFLAKRRNPRQA